MAALPSPGTATCMFMQVVPARIKSSSGTPIWSTSNINKRKRRSAGTPDPDAEVVALSPKALTKSDRYLCEICNQGFQRDQNLQMHRRRHKVPWKLLKRPTPEVRKRVYVCPDPTCLHNDPCHALGDLVGIKKHFRRKHSIEKQWKCERCSKEYAVQSDYKAHLKICGTRRISCDCGRVFSRVESFIEHQYHCIVAKERGTLRYDDLLSQPCLTMTTSSSNETASATRFALSLEDRSIDYANFYEQQAWLQMDHRELQLLPANNQSDSSETAPAGTINGNTAVISRSYIKSAATDSRWNPAVEARCNTFRGSSIEGDEDTSESAAWLQLSIGPYTHYQNKHVKQASEQRDSCSHYRTF